MTSFVGWSLICPLHPPAFRSFTSVQMLHTHIYIYVYIYVYVNIYICVYIYIYICASGFGRLGFALIIFNHHVILAQVP